MSTVYKVETKSQHVVIHGFDNELVKVAYTADGGLKNKNIDDGNCIKLKERKKNVVLSVPKAMKKKFSQQS